MALEAIITKVHNDIAVRIDFNTLLSLKKLMHTNTIIGNEYKPI